jgi:tRNA(Ile)-lysidine synthase
MLKEVKDFIIRHQLIDKDTTIIVGVSGGPDSLALLHFFWNHRSLWDVHIIAAHVDHMFRGKQSEEDMTFVENYCELHDIPFEGAQIDVMSYQQKNRVSAQVAARECRFKFFQQIMEKHQAKYVALGHHGDDQVETILMRLVRGSTREGQAGIQAKRPFSTGFIIRPFLAVNKEMIKQYCSLNELQPRIDPSNEKTFYTRNRFRKNILPFLKEENRNVHERFQQFSEALLEDEKYLQELTAEKMNTVIRRIEVDEIILKISRFVTMPNPLQRRGIQLILNYLYGEIPSSLSNIHIESLLTLLLDNRSSGTLHFPHNLRVERTYDDCILTFHENKNMSYCYTIDGPGQSILPDGSVIITEVWEHYPNDKTGNNYFIMDADILPFPLKVRNRVAGDKMTLKGMKGRKKVKDIFIDRKIPMKDRDIWPIVENGSGEIIWLPGLKKSSYEAIDRSKGRYILLQHKGNQRLGGKME